MRDYDTYRKTAIRYWEWRRLFYNLALVVPSCFAYLVAAGFDRMGDDYNWHPYYVVFLFTLSALGANICYTFAYALEFLFGSDDPSSRWQRFGRKTAFITGVLFAMMLAFFGGMNIAAMEFYYQ
jgi:hypothetical protein